MPKYLHGNNEMLDIQIGVLEHRYSKPIFALLDGFEIKFALASVLTFLAEKVLPSIYKAIETDANLITSLAILVILDLFTGVWASIKNKRAITSLGFRSTIVKVVEYIFLLLPLTVLSNMSESLSWIQLWAYIFICATEVKSIGENVFGSESAAKKMLAKFWEVLKQKNNIDVN